jgi:hypothetical protein
MATTETKPGFRLPWSASRTETIAPAGDTLETAAPEAPESTKESETTDMIDAATAANAPEADVQAPVSFEPDQSAPQGPAGEADAAVAPDTALVPEPTQALNRKPNKFMADLTRAMHTAAESAREDTLARFALDAKAHIETIHADSAVETSELRQLADDDVAAVRDWSKAEIARIRLETDERISYRKSTLESEIEEHAAAVEARVARVQARVDAFEAEMSAFFERLLAEEEPTRFAAMAETLPEPPPFDGPAPVKASAPAPTPEVTAEATVVEPEAAEIEATAAEPAAAIDAEAVVETDVATPSADEAVADDLVAKAIQEMTAAAAPAAAAPAENAPAEDAPAEDAGDLFSIGVGDESKAEDDPRLSMLGLTAGFAAAEAEAASEVSDGADEEMPEIPGDAIAARMAGLVPASDTTTTTTTRVVVNGLISVASIAGFKRNLSRATGIQSVGVSSGPDGEFVFAVGHGSDVVLGDVIATLPGFNARVTGSAEGEITVAAEDPEAQH